MWCGFSVQIEERRKKKLAIRNEELWVSIRNQVREKSLDPMAIRYLGDKNESNLNLKICEGGTDVTLFRH